MKPVIALTPEAITLRSRMDGRGAFCGVSYSAAIEAAGGVPLILPLTDDRSVLDQLMKSCRGLLLTGGGDVSHKFYAPRMPVKLRAKITGADETRDRMEIYLTLTALKNDWPVFGICRGIQVMNVALGGTLIPDLPGHRNPQPDALCQTIRWANGTTQRVNTSHHQALDRVAKCLRVTARAEDEVIEAVELPSAKYFRGVQFHPERLQPALRPMFTEFIRACC